MKKGKKARETERETAKMTSVGHVSQLHLLIAWVVDHSLGDVLVHKNKEGQSEAESHGSEGSGQRQLFDVSPFNFQNFAVPKVIHCK